jgi:ABC-type nitrate/sulfonate/bicarbonate transport system ATPase subunit
MRTTTEAPPGEPFSVQGPAGAPVPPAVRVTDVRRAYRSRRGEVLALDGVSLTVQAGEIVAVVGASGCGKSTLLELVCGLQRPDAGTVTAEPAALMPQRDLLLPWLSAIDNAALPLRIKGRSRAAARDAARTVLARFGLAEFERASPDELSGGMRQRVAFARTLLAGKPVLALDEPFGALDALTRIEAQSWLEQALDEAQRTVVLVTHDVEEAVVLGDRVAVMTPRPGRIAAVVEVDVPRPRRRSDPAVVALRERVLEMLGAS